MKVVVLGATGRTRRLVTAELTSRGHEVVAFVGDVGFPRVWSFDMAPSSFPRSGTSTRPRALHGGSPCPSGGPAGVPLVACGVLMGWWWWGCTSLVESAQTVMHADFVDDALRTLRAAAPGDLVRVAEAAALVAHADHLLVQVVREARGAGRSWSQIAAQLQVSTAHARQRWGPPRSGGGRVDLQWSPELAPHRADDGVHHLVSVGAPGAGPSAQGWVAPTPSA